MQSARLLKKTATPLYRNSNAAFALKKASRAQPAYMGAYPPQ